MGNLKSLVKVIDKNNLIIDKKKVKFIDQTGDEQPMVTVTMITYNHEDYIEEAIKGVVSQQTNFKFVLLIGEDCSTDNTREICLRYQRQYPDLIQLKLPERNLGINTNSISNKKLCIGKYIAENEGDDYWTDPLKLQKQVDFLESNPDYVLCFHQVSILKTNGEIVDDFITKVPENYENIETLASLGNYIHTPSVVFRNVIKEFPFELSQCPIGDYFLYIMLAEHGKLNYIEDTMAVYRYGVGVFSGNSRIKMANNNLKLFTCLLSYLSNVEIKKIIFNRQLDSVSHLENVLTNQYKGFFVSNNVFFKTIKFIQDNYKQPSKIMNKIIFKVVK